MCDSMAADFCSAYGDATGATPHLHELARRGVTFDRAYCNSPLCTPSRASIMTGRYASDIRCFDNASDFASEWPTFGHVLGAAGYETTIVGKMHFVGHDQWHGFDHRVALETDYATGYDAASYKLAYDWSWPSAGNPVGHNWMGPSYVQRPEWDHFPLHYDRDELIHKEALNYLKDKQSGQSPFFCCVSYHAPHNPFWIPEKFRDRFRDQDMPLPEVPEGIDTCHGPMDQWLNDFHYVDEIKDQLVTKDNLRWLYETFYGMLYDLDQRVGELMAALKANGQTENTAVIFVSDHGDMMGHRGMIQKRYFYEKSIRVPMIAALPGTWAQGVRISTPVSLIDLLPTLADLAGADIPDDLPGISLRSSLETGSEPDEKTIFCEYHGEGVHAPCLLALRGDMKFIYVHEQEERLYDTQNDPDEYQNLINHPAHATTAANLKRELLERFDPQQIADNAIRSQKNRRFIHRCETNRS